MSSKNSVKRKSLLVMLLTLLIFFIFTFKRYPHVVERYYADTVFSAISRALHSFFNLFPFSVGDVIYVLAILLLLRIFFQLIRLLVTKRVARAGSLFLNTVVGLQLTVVVFYLLWGLNYFRPPAIERLNLRDNAYVMADLIDVTAMLIDSANTLRHQLKQNDLQQGNAVIIGQAVSAVASLSDQSQTFHSYAPLVKTSLLSGLLNYLGTAGYYNPFTGEAQFNSMMPVFVRPVTACHEMAHQMGFNREDEANFVGFLAATKSNDTLLKYSAYYLGIQEFMFEVMSRDSVAYRELKKKISPRIIADLKAERDFWMKYRGAAGALTSIFYDRYLKVNNQPEGLLSYNRMIRLTMAWYMEKKRYVEGN